jgi:protein gp37
MMAETSLISWTDHTFAPWFGCTRVSEECYFCYAEDWTVRRFHKAEWGPHAPRVRSAQSTWKQPLAWQRKAAKLGIRHRVFCSELSDVFDNQALEEWRRDIWELIRQCPDLDWLLLTKRVPNARKMLPEGWPWPHVWLGTTAGTQLGWTRDVNLLRTIPATVRFVSVEPMLEPIKADLIGIDWVICGGETDPRKKGRERPTDPDWCRSLLRQCRHAGVPFYMKQMTSNAPIPEDLMVREFPARPGQIDHVGEWFPKGRGGSNL